VSYRVFVENEEGYARGSEKRTVDNSSGLILDFVPFDAVQHPQNPTLYLLDRSGEDSRVVVVNHSTMSVVEERSLNGEIGYIAVGDNGSGVELYAPSNDGWVYIYDAETLDEVDAIQTGLPNTSTVIDGRGHVYVSMHPDPWWDDPLRTYDRETGMHIDGGGDFDQCRLRMLPGNQEIIEISTSVSPIDMDYYRFNEDATFRTHMDDPYHGDHPLDPNIYRVSPSEEYLITSSEGAVYNADSSMEYQGQLQHGSLQFSDFAFSADGSTIYAGTQNQASIQVGSYPELTREREIKTRGRPVYLFRQDAQLISVSRTSSQSSEVGVEVISLQEE
jgi:hypothetical protein